MNGLKFLKKKCLHMTKNNYIKSTMKEFFNYSARPEVDTIRLFLKVDREKCNLRGFFENEFSREVCTIEPMKDENGVFILDENGEKSFKPIWEKKRLDHRFSSYSKMQITEDYIRWGQKNQYYYSVICVEFSVPKYYKFTNGINRGVSAENGGVMDFMSPVFEALFSLNLCKYWHDTRENIEKYLLDNFQVRRLDLSYNFHVSDVKTALIHLSSCRLPKSEAEVKVKSKEDIDKESFNPEREGDFTSVTFGGHRGSMYKCIFYDKATEQKKLFATFEQDLSYENRKEKKEWYKNNSPLFQNIVRFEVQFHFRFFIYHIKDAKYKKGSVMAEKIINLCSGYWEKLLKRFDEQLNTLNHHDEKEYLAIDSCLDRLKGLRDLGVLSRTQHGTLHTFIVDCHQNGYKNVQKTMSKSLFSQYYNKVKKLTEFDLKAMCKEQLPIIHVMELYGESYLEKGIHSLYFDCPDYSKREAV